MLKTQDSHFAIYFDQKVHDLENFSLELCVTLYTFKVLL